MLAVGLMLPAAWAILVVAALLCVCMCVWGWGGGEMHIAVTVIIMVLWYGGNKMLATQRYRSVWATVTL
jgi:hypothetical protein